MTKIMTAKYLPAALAFAAAFGLAGAASAEPISSADAHARCWAWTRNMDTHTEVCGFCEYFTMKPRCHFYACDDAGCDTVTVERRRIRGKWQFVPASPAVGLNWKFQ
jgi:hypothetical protein